MRSSSFCLACEVLKCLEFKRNFFNFYIVFQVDIYKLYKPSTVLFIMASPSDKKGQRRGLCGHIMVSFDMHKRCARCRDKAIDDDDCVEKRPCAICDGFSEVQKEILSTPTYKLCKEKKTGVLVSTENVTVIASIEDKDNFSFISADISTFCACAV